MQHYLKAYGLMLLSKCREIIYWRKAPQKISKYDPLLALRGSRRDLWADEHADEYVERLRSNWG